MAVTRFKAFPRCGAGRLRKCLGGLSPDHREIVDLVYYDEKSVEEVAEIIGIPENTLKTRVRKNWPNC